MERYVIESPIYTYWTGQGWSQHIENAKTHKPEELPMHLNGLSLAKLGRNPAFWSYKARRCATKYSVVKK